MTHIPAASARGHIAIWKIVVPFALSVAALLAFQTIPLIGGIFFVLTTTLTTWAIYAFLVLVAVLAIMRRVRPRWGILPALAFGALVILHFLSAMAADNEVLRVEAENLEHRAFN
jgi:O-antigen ligase